MQSEKTKEYYRAYYQKNKEKFAAKSKKYYHAHKEEGNKRRRAWYQAHKEEITAKRRIWWKKYYEENKDQIRERYAEWAKKNRIRYNATQRAWRDKNPDKVRAILRRAEAKLKATHPVKQWEVTLTNGMKQYVCGRTESRAVNMMREWGIRRSDIKSIREYCTMPELNRWKNKTS